MDGGRRDPQARAAATVCSHGPWRGMVPPPQVECSEIILKAINVMERHHSSFPISALP